MQLDLMLRPNAPGCAQYPALRDAMGSAAVNASIKEVAQTVAALRRHKAMLLDNPTDADQRSAGSFFTNPIVPLAHAETLQATAGGAMPVFSAGAGQCKLSAAWLIEQAGFLRGYSQGKAGLSTKHALAVTNRGGATAQEVLGFAINIAAGVQQKFSVRLMPEVRLLGFASQPWPL